jgi:phosphonate transport system substrate-binding protein
MIRSKRETLVLGAVAYDPKVVTIWDGFQRFFGEHGVPFDYVLYTNYERQVEGHFAGEIDLAWNSPLAWIEADRLAPSAGKKARTIAMRDTDRDLTSVVLVRSDGAVRGIADLAGKKVAVGAGDSPQATILPLLHLAEHGVTPRRAGEKETAKGPSFEYVLHDVLVGKHGDHVGGERDAVKALLAGEVDAACILDANTITFANDGTTPEGALRPLTSTAPFDHCNFTVLDDAGGAASPKADLIAKVAELLLGMSYGDPAIRPLMDLEGLKQWKPGRTEGYAALARACDRFGTIDAWLAPMKDHVARPNDRAR